MRSILHDGVNAYEIGHCAHLRAGGAVYTFADRSSASAFLLRFASDPAKMATLRRLIAEQEGGSSLRDSSDQRVIEQVAQLLVSRRFCLALRPRLRLPMGGLPTQPQQQPAPPARQAARAVAPASSSPQETPPPQGSELPQNLDAAATAAVMQQAANEGAPFCEV